MRICCPGEILHIPIILSTPRDQASDVPKPLGELHEKLYISRAQYQIIRLCSRTISTAEELKRAADEASDQATQQVWKRNFAH